VSLAPERPAETGSGFNSMADLALPKNPFVSETSPDQRVLLFRQTYTHVAGAWLAFFYF